MFFSIEGVIGVGKTTLARLLQPAFEANLLLEVFEENPFLGDFYSDRARYGLSNPDLFLAQPLPAQRNVSTLLAQGRHLISDYTFEKDALFALVNLSGDELEMYYRYIGPCRKIAQPNLLVYLRADTEVLMQRITLRDRPYEENHERSYIEDLNQAYDDFFLSQSQHPWPC